MGYHYHLAFCTETKSPSFKSNVNEVLNPVTVLLPEDIETVPPSVKDVSNTKSVVNLLPGCSLIHEY